MSRSAILAAAAILTLSACEQREAPIPRETLIAVELPERPDTATVPVPETTWSYDAGPALFIAGQTPSRAIVVFPEITELRQGARFDDARLRDVTLDLFDRGGLVGQAQLVGVSEEPGLLDCASWPQGVLVPVGQSAALPSWSVAFVSGRVRPLSLRGIDQLARADSARLAAEAARLAAAIPADTASPFQGIPFFVRMAYLFEPAAGVDALVAEVVRRVPLEASPLEEHIILVAERPANRPDARYTTVFHDRVSGVDTAVSSWEVLGAVRLGEGGRPALVLDSILYEGDIYLLFVREPDGRWTVSWVSAYAGC